MTTAPAVPDNAIQLENGKWCVVRRLSVADIRTAKLAQHERGYDDPDLDAIGLLPDVITDTSDGPVTQAFVDQLSENDYGVVWMKVKGVEIPNASAPSSTGTPAKARRASSRTSG